MKQFIKENPGIVFLIVLLLCAFILIIKPENKKQEIICTIEVKSNGGTDPSTGRLDTIYDFIAESDSVEVHIGPKLKRYLDSVKSNK